MMISQHLEDLRGSEVMRGDLKDVQRQTYDANLEVIAGTAEKSFLLLDKLFRGHPFLYLCERRY